jgi:hypothetical protein
MDPFAHSAEETMKQIFPRAHTPRRTYLPTKRKVIWATQPYSGRLGTYIGIAHEGDALFVAVETAAGSPRWVGVTDALSDVEAEAWVAFGFRHNR